MLGWIVTRAFLVLLTTGITSASTVTPRRENVSTASSKERTFFVVFMETLESPAHLALQLSSYDKPCTVHITVPNPPYSETVLLAKNSTLEVNITSMYMLREGTQSSKLVTVSSDADISVIAFNSAPMTADAIACLSRQELGTEYYIFTSGDSHRNQFAVGNGEDFETQVSVTVVGSLFFNGTSYTNMQTFSFILGPKKVILLGSIMDLTGTRVTSSTPVAVFSGNKCYWSGLGGGCDLVVEQLFPVQSWGQTFVAFPLMSKKEKDNIYILAARSNTTVDILHHGGTIAQYRLEPGSNVRLNLGEGILVNSSEPIMVTYLFEGSQTALEFHFDPFLAIVPPNNFSRRYYKFVTQDVYYNYLFIVSQSSSLSEFLLDHRPLNGNVVTVQHLEGFTGWEVELGKTGGQHEIYHRSETFMVYVYGVESFISYGYSPGQAGFLSGPEEPEDPEDPDEEPEFTCLSHHGEYRLPLSLVSDAELSIQDIHLNSPECQARQEGQWAVITVPFDKCGTQVLVEYGRTVYVNTVYGSVPNATVHRIEIPLRCEMVDNETLSLQFHPTVNNKVAVGHHNLSFGLYRSEDFTDPITAFPYEIDLHGMVYVEFEVESNDENLQIYTENCKSSPSLSPEEESYSLLKHGCPQDTTLRTYPSADQRAQRFGFHVFKFGDSPEVYLFCDVIICHNDSSTNRCTQGCSGQRHRRDLSSSGLHIQSARLSQGPIIFKPGMSLQPEGFGRKQNTSSSSTIIGALCGTSLLAAMALLVQRRYYKRQSQGYRALRGTDE